MAAGMAGRLRVERLDMTRPSEIVTLRERLADNRLDVLIVNAGISDHNVPVAEIDEAAFNEVMSTNALAPLKVIESLQDLVVERGAIAVMSSRQAYARRAVESVSAFDWTHHRLCNFVIAVAGERAHGKVDVVAQMQAPRTDNGSAPPMLTVGGRYDLEFGKVATEWRITKRHMRTRYTIGDPAALARARGQHHT